MTLDDGNGLIAGPFRPPQPSARTGEPTPDIALDEAKALLRDAESELAKIEQTIESLGFGTHASCAICGGAIEPERLIASPTVRRCAAHAEQN